MGRSDEAATTAIRNVVVVGHTATGKSTLVEAMLRVAEDRAPTRDDRPVLVDHDPDEQQAGHSLQATMVSFLHDGHRVNVLDTPGLAEAIGDAHPALAAADVALFVVDANVGVQPQHEQLWRVCQQLALPRVVFLNKLDQERAGYQVNVDDLRERYGRPLAPVHMPLGIHDEFDGLIDLLHFTAVEFRDGKRIEEDVPDQRVEQAERNRELLVEAVVENDDDLLERYLEGEVPDTAEIAELFAHGVAGCGFFPVLCGSARLGIGVELLLDFLVEECPSPAAVSHGVALDEPTAVLCVKTLSDQYVGRINVLRVLAGGLAADDELTGTRTGSTERLHQLFRLVGEERQPVDRVPAGDMVAVAKLDDVHTGDVLTADGRRVEVTVPEPPVGHHRVVLEPESASDDDKLSTSLARLLEDDPSIRTERDDDAGVLVCRFLGPTHADVAVRRLAGRYGVHVTARPAPIAFRETLRGPASGVGRHVKQSGGHGQYGIAHVDVAPLARGEGFRFEDEVVGGAIPRQYIASVEIGVREAMREGPLGGFPVVDVQVTVTDGKSHSVDSSDGAFRMAGLLAFRDAMARTEGVLLEPMMEVTVVVPDDLTGAVMGDLSSRRGRILGSTAAAGGRVAIEAHVPAVELEGFAGEFQALTSGRGEVSMEHGFHDEVPAAVATRLLEQHAHR